MQNEILGLGLHRADRLVNHFKQRAFDHVRHRVQCQIVGSRAKRVFDFCSQCFQREEGVGNDADDDRCHRSDAAEQAEG